MTTYPPHKEIKIALRMLGFYKPDRDVTMTLTKARALAAIVVLSQFLDFGSTFIGITHAGAAEANPGMAWLMANFGWLGFAAAKTLGTMLLLWITWRRTWASLVIAGVYAAVVGWNLTTIATGL